MNHIWALSLWKWCQFLHFDASFFSRSVLIFNFMKLKTLDISGPIYRVDFEKYYKLMRFIEYLLQNQMMVFLFSKRWADTFCRPQFRFSLFHRPRLPDWPTRLSIHVRSTWTLKSEHSFNHSVNIKRFSFILFTLNLIESFEFIHMVLSLGGRTTKSNLLMKCFVRWTLTWSIQLSNKLLVHWMVHLVASDVSVSC